MKSGLLSSAILSLSASCMLMLPLDVMAVSRGNMPAYCRGEVSGQYGTKPMYVKTAKPKRAKDGSTTIRGTVDKGSEGIKAFECQFDAKGRFIGVMALTSDGE
ncbi:hypothetical protein [Kaistia adipata]|uniref:hypothetical protein n=1 Tax=Kaistia adipata TaxID=166954 RepID=UPI0012EB8232|nr:hypothetical protein [Kaistia adipata]